MKREEKVKESQYLWELEKLGMLENNKELYQPVIDVLDPLFKSGTITYNEWVDQVAEVFSKHALDSDKDRTQIVKEVWEEIIEYYKQFKS